MIASIWGIEGSGKSTIGLTYPKPLFQMEFDIGGFDRAIWRIESESEKAGKKLNIYRCEPGEDISRIDFSNLDIITKSYVVPVQLEKLLGAQKQGTGKEASIRFPRQIIGYKELWQSAVIDFVAACQAAAIKTLLVDSATQLWLICHTSLLQEKQEIQLSKGIKVTANEFREKLQPVEFPNDRMKELLYTAKSYGKHLVMTHYPKDIYAEKLVGERIESYRTGEVTPDGFKHTVTIDDIVLWAYTEVDKQREITDMTAENYGKKSPNPNYNKPQPHAKISLKCGLPGMGMTAVGLELPEPSYDGLLQLQSMMRGES